MSRWKKFRRKVKKWDYRFKDKKYIYIVEIKYYPDVDVATKKEAKRLVKNLKKVGIKARYKRIKNGIVMQVGLEKLVARK